MLVPGGRSDQGGPTAGGREIPDRRAQEGSCVRRAHWAVGVIGTATMALSPLAVPALTATATASAGTATTTAPAAGGPDRSFTPTQRREAIADARQTRGATAGRLALGAQQSLVVRDVLRDADGTEHVRYDRTYAGLPVVGGDLVTTQTPSGAVTDATWAGRRTISLPTTDAAVSGATARRSTARTSGLSAGAAVKVVYAADHAPVLAWRTTVTGTAADGTPIDDLVYTDARTGARLARVPQVLNADGTGATLYSGSVSLQTTLSGATYALTDATRGGHSTYDAGNTTSTARGTLFTDADNVWGDGRTSNRQSAAADAAFGAATTWDFYKAHFGRTGIRNDGVAAYSRVHYGSGYDNAFWSDSCFCMTYGDGGASFTPLTSLDVAGHEMSHGVTAATARLNYSKDAGGLNESTSDVMGTMVEFQAAVASDPGDYYIGEKITKGGGYLRRMDNPSLDGGSRNCWSTKVARLDPHYSSGVGNHLFYLLAEGSGAKTIGGLPHSSPTCDGSTVTGIGRDAAAAIWYRGLTTYWTSTTTYPQAVDGLVKGAKDLYGAGSAQCAATLKAARAVSVTPTATCS